MSFDGYGGDGHAFSEIFDTQRQHWIFVDSFYSFYVTDEHCCWSVRRAGDTRGHTLHIRSASDRRSRTMTLTCKVRS